MARMTKAQAKRLLKAIDSKAHRLWDASSAPGSERMNIRGWLSTADMIAIEKIVRKNLKRLG